jgi:hypothetical protein
MAKDVIGVFILLIMLFLLLKDGATTGKIITAIATQTASTVTTLQGRG